MQNLLLELLKNLTALYNAYAKLLEKQQIKMKTNNELIYETALAWVGKDASPRDIAPDEYSCFESVDEIVKLATGLYINGTANRVEVSTYRGYQLLKDSPYFRSTTQPKAGTLIISPTGYKKTTSKIANGHIGVCDGQGGIMSVTSLVPGGRFQKNYTIESWKNRWEKDGYLIAFFDHV